MEMSNKEEFSAKNRDNDTSYRKCDSVNTLADRRISASNSTISYPPENPMSICQVPSQMMDSFRQNLCPESSFNVHTPDQGTSFRGNTEIPVQMGWNMAQFRADSGFIERAAKFSFFGCGSFGEMMMHQQSLGVPESAGLFLQDTENAGGSKLVNVSDDSQSSGGNGHDAKCGETSSKWFNKKKRKGTGKNSEPDQSQRAQQSGGEEEYKKQKDGQSPNAYANKTNIDSPKDGYIHMRARRGQATNSHSLAERVRREKISERMKFLQDLVPGCDKVTGKAVMLDEIINYVQSLQCQIEFLSMKLSTVNPPIDFNLESLLAKDTLQVAASTFPQNMSMLYPPPSFLSQSNFMQPNHSSISLLNGGLKRQEAPRYENDHHNVVQMNHEIGMAPDHEDETGERKSQISTLTRYLETAKKIHACLS